MKSKLINFLLVNFEISIFFEKKFKSSKLQMINVGLKIVNLKFSDMFKSWSF